MVTIKQIADLANVSRGTVDKVLNDRPGVKDSTRELVKAIAAELNYTPNPIGKLLVSRDPLVLGVILPAPLNLFYQEILAGIDEAAAEFAMFGIEVVKRFTHTQESLEQLTILRELSSQGVDALVLIPMEDPTIIETLNAIVFEGTPVVTLHTQVPAIQALCHIGQNHYKAGRIAAGLMAKLLPNGGDIGILVHSLQHSSHAAQQAGFCDHIKSLGKRFHVVETLDTFGVKNEVFKSTIALLNNHTNLKGIYITSDGIGGINSALNIIKKNDSIKMICNDSALEFDGLLSNRFIDFAIGQNPRQTGFQAIKTLYDALFLKKSPASAYQEIPITVLIAESLDH